MDSDLLCRSKPCGSFDSGIQFVGVGDWGQRVIHSTDQKCRSLDAADPLLGDTAQASGIGCLHAFDGMGRAQAQNQILLYQLVGYQAVIVVEVFQILALSSSVPAFAICRSCQFGAGAGGSETER